MPLVTGGGGVVAAGVDEDEPPPHAFKRSAEAEMAKICFKEREGVLNIINRGLS